MEPKFNTSFIPKKSLQDIGGGANGKYVGRRDVYGPSFFFSLFLFFLAVVATVALFTYSNITENTIDEKITALENKKNVFNSEEITALIRSDIQIKNVKKLVTEHTTISELLTLLEQITLKRLQYTNLEFKGIPNEISSVTLDGVTKNFQDVALQTEQYRNSTYLRDPIVRKLERLESDDVEFSIDVVINPQLLTFSELLKRKVLVDTGNSQGLGNSQETIMNSVQDTEVKILDEPSLDVKNKDTAVTTGNGTNTGVSGEDGAGSGIHVNDTGAFVNTN